MEQLNHLLYKDLCVEVMKQYKNKPKKLHAFVLSGREPYYAFLDICRSIKSLTITDATFTAQFSDPDVDDVFTCIGRWHGSKKAITKKLFHHAKKLKLEFVYLRHSNRRFFSHLRGLKSVEELDLFVHEIRENDGFCLKRILKCIGPVKQMTAKLYVFSILSLFVKDVKLDKMVVNISVVDEMQDVVNLTNFIPVELHIIAKNHSDDLDVVFQAFKVEPDNNFAGVKKLKFLIDNDTGSISKADEQLFFDSLKSIETQFPNLEDVVFHYGFYDSQNISVPPNEGVIPTVVMIQRHIETLHQELSKHSGKFKLHVIHQMFYEIDEDDEVFVPYFNKLKSVFKEYKYSVDGKMNFWRKTFAPKTDVVFEVQLALFKFDVEDGQYVDSYGNVGDAYFSDSSYSTVDYYQAHAVQYNGHHNYHLL